MINSFLDQIKFQYFPSNIWEAKPLGEVTLRQFLNSHKNPKENIVEVFNKIKEAARVGDLETKDRLKRNNLFSFTPSSILDGKGRSYDNVIGFNPILIVEFDKIDHAEELKKDLFKRLDCIVAAYISPSRRGVKFIVRIPTPKSIEEYKEYWCGLAYYLSRFEGFDPANYNLVLPLFLSYDKDILVNENAKEWTKKGGKINSFKYNAEPIEAPENIEEGDTAEVISLITYLIDRIEDNGHNQVLSTALCLGGFTASGYLTVEEALDLIRERIESNDYLAKGVSGYKKTAETMFNRGLSSPMLLDKHK